MGDDALQIDRVISLHEGANTRLAAHLLPETQAVDMENMVVSHPGQRSRRKGVRAFGGRNEQPGGVHGYIKTDLSRELMGVWGEQLYSTAGGGAWAQIATGISLSPNRLTQFVDGLHLDGRMVFMASVNAPQTGKKLAAYNITSDENTNSTLAPDTIEWFQGRLWAGEDDTVWWSDLLDGLTYDAANSILVQPGEAGRVMRLMKARGSADRMWIFKEKAIHLFLPTWTGTASDSIPGAADSLDVLNSELRVLTDGVGCVATRSAIWVPAEQGADVLFLAHDGIRSMARAEQDVEGGAGPPLSDSIPDWIARINFSAPIIGLASAAYYDDAYHLAVPMDGAENNTHILRYEPRRKGWSLHKLAVRDMEVLDLSGTQHDLWMQSNVRGNDSSVTDVVSDATLPHQVYRVFDGNIDPNSTRVEWSEVSRAFIFDEPMKRKRWDHASLLLSAPETAYVQVEVRTDYGDWDTAATFLLPGAKDAIVLGEDPLTWESGELALRRKDVFLRDVNPGYNLQMRLSSATDTSDSGQVTLWVTEVHASLFDEEYLNDD